MKLMQCCIQFLGFGFCVLLRVSFVVQEEPREGLAWPVLASVLQLKFCSSTLFP